MRGVDDSSVKFGTSPTIETKTGSIRCFGDCYDWSQHGDQSSCDLPERAEGLAFRRIEFPEIPTVQDLDIAADVSGHSARSLRRILESTTFHRTLHDLQSRAGRIESGAEPITVEVGNDAQTKIDYFLYRCDTFGTCPADYLADPMR